jgi:diaminopimelate epimerase
LGVGGDGLILICPSDAADAEMKMYNADGSFAEMCGNGIRCVAKYVYDHGISRKATLRLASANEIYQLEPDVRDGLVDAVRVDMTSSRPTAMTGAGASGEMRETSP